MQPLGLILLVILTGEEIVNKIVWIRHKFFEASVVINISYSQSNANLSISLLLHLQST